MNVKSNVIAGQFPKKDTGSAVIIGAGTSDTARKNAFEVTQDGKLYILGTGGYDGTNLDEADVKPVAEVIAESGGILQSFKDATDPTKIGYGTEGSRTAGYAVGKNSFTFGTGNSATKECGFAIGVGTGCSSSYALALGNGSSALGSGSLAHGIGATTTHSGELATGAYNVSTQISGTDGAYTVSTGGVGNTNYQRRNAYEFWSDGKLFLKGLGGFDGTNSTVTNSGKVSFNPDVKDVASLLGGNAEKEVDVFLFLGQSNMAGRGVTSTEHPEGKPTIIPGAGYEFRAISDPTKLYTMAEPFGVDENKTGGISEPGAKTGSMVTAFTNSYYQQTGVTVIGVSASKGGSKISEWQPGTAYLTDAIQRYKDCIAFLEASTEPKYKIRHKYMLFCQGCSDADQGTAEDEYETMFNAMFDKIRTELNIEKAFMVRIGQCNSNTANTKYVYMMRCQNHLAQVHDLIVMASLSFAGMKERGLMKDAFHYYQQGYNEVGTEAGRNVGFYVNTGKEPTMYDPLDGTLFYNTYPNPHDEAVKGFVSMEENLVNSHIVNNIANLLNCSKLTPIKGYYLLGHTTVAVGKKLDYLQLGKLAAYPNTEIFIIPNCPKDSYIALDEVNGANCCVYWLDKDGIVLSITSAWSTAYENAVSPQDGAIFVAFQWALATEGASPLGCTAFMQNKKDSDTLASAMNKPSVFLPDLVEIIPTSKNCLDVTKIQEGVAFNMDGTYAYAANLCCTDYLRVPKTTEMTTGFIWAAFDGTFKYTPQGASSSLCRIFRGCSYDENQNFIARTINSQPTTTAYPFNNGNAINYYWHRFSNATYTLYTTSASDGNATMFYKDASGKYVNIGTGTLSGSASKCTISSGAYAGTYNRNWWNGTTDSAVPRYFRLVFQLNSGGTTPTQYINDLKTGFVYYGGTSTTAPTIDAYVPGYKLNSKYIS